MKTLLTLFVMMFWLNMASAGIWNIADIPENYEKKTETVSPTNESFSEVENVKYSSQSEQVTGTAARNCYRCYNNPNVRFAEL